MVEHLLRCDTKVSESQFGFMPRRSTMKVYPLEVNEEVYRDNIFI